MSSTKHTSEVAAGPLVIVRLREENIQQLVELFIELDAEPSSFFRPHPFTSVEAVVICTSSGKDMYFGYALASSGKLVAYGMLRGWDGGHEHPSLGIVVSPQWRGKGVGFEFMVLLHVSARGAGAKRVRLRVDPNNIAARRLYEKQGYFFSGELDRGELVGWLDLSLPLAYYQSTTRGTTDR